MEGAFATNEAKLTDCRKNYSFYFDLIEKEWAGNNLRAPIHRICTLMRKMHVQALLCENLELNDELLNERDAVAILRGHSTTAKAVRVTFFRHMPPSCDWQALEDADVMGYAVILTLVYQATNLSYIYEAVIRPPSLFLGGKWMDVSNYYVHCIKDFKTTIGTRSLSRNFTFPGTFFCQQNGITHVCAHAALRSALNNWRSYSGAKITSKLINEALGIDHTAGKQIPHGGLHTAQIKAFVQKLGHNVLVADFNSTPDIDYDEFVYPLIESGCPVVLGIVRPGIAHVVSVIGHTLNTDRWAEARHLYGTFPSYPYIPASSWVDHFIISDDNFGMYVTLPTDSIRNLLVPKHNPNLHAALAVGLVPIGGRISGYVAEQSAAEVANVVIEAAVAGPRNDWLKVLQKKDSGGFRINPIVCRTLMATKSDYITHLSTTDDEKSNKITALEKVWLQSVLPDLFWVTEITTTNLYTGNKRKLGDVVTVVNLTDAQIKDQQWHVFAWLTGICWNGPGLSSPPRPWSLKGHIPLIRGIPNERSVSEW
jgi:hypothetical protein